MRIRGASFGALLVVLALAACTSSPAASKPSASPTPIVVTGSTTLDAPKGARSAELTVTCTGSGLSLTVGNEPEPRSMSCGTSRTMTVPTGQRLALDFEAPTGATYSATVRFSTAAFRQDAALTAQCAAATTALSDLATADNGLVEGAISSEQAQVLMAQAAQALDSTSAAGVAGRELATLRTWLIANPAADPRTAPMPQTTEQVCVDNESPLAVVSQYGG